jgi:hypothetical protein
LNFYGREKSREISKMDFGKKKFAKMETLAVFFCEMSHFLAKKGRNFALYQKIPTVFLFTRTNKKAQNFKQLQFVRKCKN